MPDFATLLSEHIHNKNIKTYALAQYCNLDRSNMYKIIKGQRKPSSLEMVEKMCKFMHLSPSEQADMEESYHIALIGRENYYRRKAVQQFFEEFRIPTLQLPATSPSNASDYADNATLLHSHLEINRSLLYIIASELKKSGGKISLLIQPDYTFLMNILTAGDYASSHAVRILVDEIREDTDYNPVKVIRHAIETANTEIIEQAQKDEKLRGMGTTMVVATIVGQYAYVANVGDSRLYVVDKQLRQITRDHSLVQEMVRMGEITAEEARNHPDKNIITRALGAEKTVDVDFFDMRLEPGSTILMCSDGLSNMVEDKKMEEIILNSDEDITWKGNTLIQEANNNGGKDNIAIILIEPFTNEVETC